MLVCSRVPTSPKRVHVHSVWMCDCIFVYKNRFVSIFILLETGCILKRPACRLMYRLCCPSMARPILLSTVFTPHLLSFWFKCKVPYVGATHGDHILSVSVWIVRYRGSCAYYLLLAAHVARQYTAALRRPQLCATRLEWQSHSDNTNGCRVGIKLYSIETRVVLVVYFKSRCVWLVKICEEWWR